MFRLATSQLRLQHTHYSVYLHGKLFAAPVVFSVIYNDIDNDFNSSQCVTVFYSDFFHIASHFDL